MLSSLILLPFILLVILNLPFKFIKKEAGFWLAGAFLLTQGFCALSRFRFLGDSVPVYLASFFSFRLEADSLSLIMLFIIGLIGFISLLLAHGTIPAPRQRFFFLNLLLISLIGMNATVMVKDIFSLYVFIEITAAAVFVLMAIEKDRFAIEGTFKYLVLSMIASIFLLSAIALFLLLAGSTSFEAIGAAASSGKNAWLLNLSLGLLLCGLLIKSGAVPFHGWVPDAYANTQSAVSVLLAGIVTKISGVYVLLRLFSSVFVLNASLQGVLLFIGAFSIVFAGLAAFRQNDIKRLLAYSSISQIGYILLALGCATPLAFAAAVFHFFNHAVFKSLLFVNAAALEKEFHSTDIAIITGMGSRLPVTSATSLIGFLSTAGIPPLAGFWSKLLIIFALFVSGRPVYAAVALLASIITLAYFLYLERSVFFIRTEPGVHQQWQVNLKIKFCEILLALIIVGAGLAFPFMLNHWFLPLREVLR